METLRNASLPPLHGVMAMVIVFVWGVNFTIIAIGLRDLPPFLFVALRFTLAALPALIWLPRPPVSWRRLIFYGLATDVGQYGFLYFAMRGFISPGLASVVLQAQAFFVIGLSILIAGEKVRPLQWLALAIGAAGILTIVSNTGGDVTVLGVAMVLCAAFSWASGNMATRDLANVNVVAFVSWAALIATPPLYLLSFIAEGPARIMTALEGAHWTAWAAVMAQAWLTTLGAYTSWAWLMARNPATSLAPLMLLIPIFGMGASAFVVHEALPGWKLLAALLVIGGLALNMAAGRYYARRATG